MGAQLINTENHLSCATQYFEIVLKGMGFKSYSYRLWVILGCLFYGSFTKAEIDKSLRSDYQEHIDSIVLESANKPIQSIAKLQQYDSLFQLAADTVYIIKCKLEISDIERLRGMYNNSYQVLWENLLLAEQFQDFNLLGAIHQDLSILYTIYNQSDKAKEHLEKWIVVAKEGFKKGEINRIALIQPYLGYAIWSRKEKDLETSKQYLDSCLYISIEERNSEQNHNYLEFEQASLYKLEGEYKKAERLLKKVIKVFEKYDTPYLVVAYSQMGNILLDLKRTSGALRFFQKSLAHLEKHNAHTEMRAELYFKIARIYNMQGEFELAYANLLKSKKISYQWFSARAGSNKELFEIRNTYQERIDEQDAQLAAQVTLLEERRELNFRLKLYLLLIGLILIITLLFNRIRLQKKRIEVVRAEEVYKREMEEDNHRKVLEVKNKELTAYTLQLIEKEKEIDSLKDHIRSNKSNDASIAILKNKNNNQLWDEFNNRFTQVNSGFYERLRVRFPDLTPTEVKHCALIKLNFSGKEMAHLLGISLNSVHISRHRLRKKMKLEREINLSTFIADI